MRLLVGTRIGKRFLITFIWFSLLFIASGWLAIQIASQTLREQTHLLLRVAADGAEAQLHEFLAALRRTTELQTIRTMVFAAFKSGDKPFDLAGYLKELQQTVPEAKEIFCINPQGKVIACSSQEVIGQDFSRSPEFQQGKQSFFAGNIIRGSDKRVRWRMSAPVRDLMTQKFLGVVVMGFNPDALSLLTSGKRSLKEGATSQSFRIGETGETYIVNKDGFFLTAPRFTTNAVLTLKAETAAVGKALAFRKGEIADYKDYRDVSVSGATAFIGDMGWVLVTEIDFSQTFAPLKALRKKLIALTLLVGLVGVFILRNFCRQIMNPLRLAENAEEALAHGEKGAAIVPERNLPHDEVGDFVRLRNAHVRKILDSESELLNEQKRRIEAANTLQAISYSMVHDMRAPLRAVSTYSDLLQRESGDQLGASSKDYISRMKASCVRMDDLICDMLRYSSLLNADVPLSAINIPDLLRDSIDADPELASHKVDIQIDNNIPLLQGNAAVLSQCFSVLLGNAFKYARPGADPKVSLWAETTGDSAKLFVEDKGIGISENFQKRLFGIFQKGTTSQGTGIGLALVRVAVERMGGRVGVDSLEGKGSKFWIELKLADLAFREARTASVQLLTRPTLAGRQV